VAPVPGGGFTGVLNLAGNVTLFGGAATACEATANATKS
jgi:hypothetical protein